ncbi:MAG: DNA recombination protein RmuC [Hyphomicrobiaceae bacterium]
MELGIAWIWAWIWAFAAGGAFGAAAGWACLSVTVGHLRADLGRAQEAETARSQELAVARGEAGVWRERLLGEQLARAAFEAEARRVSELQPELTQMRGQLAAAMVEAASLQAKLSEQAQAHGEKLALLGEVRGEIEKDFKALAADALRANQGTFVELASAVFEKHKAGADADQEGRRRAVEALVAPLQETLQSCRQQVEALEQSRAEAYGALTAEIKGVVAAQNAARGETAKLVNALRAAPKTRGRWGEQTLQNVLELSGLSAHCDFSTQESFVRGDGIARPDVVIRLPGGRSIVVDAKTSLSAYLDAAEATEDSERERLLDQHAAQLRAHVRGLAGKAYQDLMPTPDFVVMFVPGDNFYAAAAERDPALFEDAAAQGVVIVTPATLIALAKAVAFGWRQEKVAENAQAVHDLGRELYRRLSRMAEHISRCGDALGRSVQHYNQLVGSLEHSVMPQARRFQELELEGTGSELPLLQQIELQPRLLRPEAAVKEAPGNAQAA